MSDLSYQFANKCKFDLVQVDGYSSYAYSDEQMAVFTYTEVIFILHCLLIKLNMKLKRKEQLNFMRRKMIWNYIGYH